MTTELRLVFWLEFAKGEIMQQQARIPGKGRVRYPDPETGVA
jgi:hypothetical protein